MCTKLYKRTLLEDALRPLPVELKMGEDYLQNINIALSLPKVLYTDLAFYIYKNNTSSLSHSFIRSQEYENMFHKELGHMLYCSPFFKAASDELKKNIIFCWNRSRLNGYIQVCLFSGEFDFTDCGFCEVKSCLESSIPLLKFEEKLMLLITNYRLLHLMLKLYYKLRYVIGQIKKI
jgi:hypothetical protein